MQDILSNTNARNVLLNDSFESLKPTKADVIFNLTATPRAFETLWITASINLPQFIITI